MKRTLSSWFDREGRKEQLDEHIHRSGTAYFGFLKVPEKEKTARVLRHFDAVAQKYDLMNSLLSFGIHHAWKRAAVRAVGLPKAAQVIDVCGGTGDLTLLAAQAAGNGGRMVIYDINRAMMTAGKPKIAASEFGGRISLVQGDAERISFADSSFDAAMVGFGIRNVTHMIEAFREMHRVLKPGGRLMCLEFSKPANPLFRWLYDTYSFYLMPLLGRIVAGNPNAYLCLTESIRMFPIPEELVDVLSGIGFRDVVFKPLTNGIAVVHTGTKAG